MIALLCTFLAQAVFVFVLPVGVFCVRTRFFLGGGGCLPYRNGPCPNFTRIFRLVILILLQVTFPNALTPAAVEVLEKVLPPRPETNFDGEEEEPMLEVLLDDFVRCMISVSTLFVA